MFFGGMKHPPRNVAQRHVTRDDRTAADERVAQAGQADRRQQHPRRAPRDAEREAAQQRARLGRFTGGGRGYS